MKVLISIFFILFTTFVKSTEEKDLAKQMQKQFNALPMKAQKALTTLCNNQKDPIACASVDCMNGNEKACNVLLTNQLKEIKKQEKLMNDNKKKKKDK